MYIYVKSEKKIRRKNWLATEEGYMLLRILFDNSNNERNDIAKRYHSNLKNLYQNKENKWLILLRESLNTRNGYYRTS